MIRLRGSAVTASIPSFGANQYVRRAVEILLAQTHKEITIGVANDGNSNQPWAELADICDPRLIRFSFKKKRGPYFAHQVVFAASETPFFLIQDADDWSAPNRLSVLLTQLLADDSDFAFSAWQQYRQGNNGTLRPDSVRWHRKNRRSASRPPGKQPAPTNGSFLFDPFLNEEFINRASHHGVFRRQALERIGGYYSGFRMNHDTLLTNLLLMTGKVSFVEAPLYHYVIRSDSLSHSDATGARSHALAHVRAQQAAIYREALHWYRAWSNQQITSTEFVAFVRRLSARGVTAEDRAAIAFETSRLATLLRGSAELKSGTRDTDGAKFAVSCETVSCPRL